jgi:GNAT superfamily N-acetyltransferase
VVLELVEACLEDDAAHTDVDAVLAGLVAFNASRVAVDPDWEWRTLTVLARRKASVVGGAVGRTGWAWLHVSRLWVTETLRGAGLGGRLMAELEDTARRRGCVGSWLDTFSFQAKPFYEAIGYAQFGELADFPPGHVRHFLWKPLR